MCCLKYEQEAYEDLLRITPKMGAYVKTKDGRGTVVDVNLLTGILRIRLDKFPDAAPKVFTRSEVSLIRDAQIKVDSSELAQLRSLEKQ
ncbi:MAG: stage 0 sporulation protein, partial [Acetanaerobacterium sp.]